jgi:predicted  nucleic acid-binding Zn-ribbon protein
MDRHAMALLIPIFAMLIGGFVVFSRSALGHALARRIGGGADGSPGLESEVRELRGEVEALRGELTETQERLDFTERMLASGKQES